MLVFASAIIVYFLKSLDSFNSISYFSIWSIIMLIALNAVIELYNRVLYSEHKGYWPNIFPAISMVMSTCGIGILYLLELKDIVEDGLQIPHAGLLQRDFALLPFADLEPNWRFPVEGDAYHKTAYELSQRFEHSSTAIKLGQEQKKVSYAEA